MRLSKLTSVLVLVSAVTAAFEMPKPMRDMTRLRKNSDNKLVGDGNGSPSGQGNVTEAYFDQLIDHSRPELGTFKQRYFYNTMYYKGPGSPISVEAPPEAGLDPEGVDGSNATMPGFIGQQVGGAFISIEHRYYGVSSPIGASDYDVAHLQTLTLENAVDDLVYFARNVKLPFDLQGKSHPDKAPWILSGCSYPGALSAWTQKLNPGTFWAYEAGSAVVQARNDLWQYYLPIESAMPKNCSADWKLVMQHIDQVVLHGSAAEKKKLQKDMGADGFSDEDLLAYAVSWLYDWQKQQYTGNGFSSFFETCDFIENQVPPKSPAPGPGGVGLEKALAGYFRSLTSNEGKKRLSLAQSKGDGGDPWDWQLCNEPFQWWITERPGTPYHMTSASATVEQSKDAVCYKQYPDMGKYKVGIKLGRDEDTVNRLTGGWEGVANLTRIAWVNADFDPWLYATVSSPDRPGGPLQSTENAPVYWLRGTAHCNDYYTKNYHANEDARKMFDGVASNMKKWVAEFYKEKNITRPA